MNSGFRSIDPRMPLDRAAALMVRRGECQSFFLARARIERQRRCACRTEITPADKAAFSNIEPPRLRLPYKDE